MTKPYLITLILFFFVVRLFAQAPSINYPGPQIYNAFSPIMPLAPTSSGVAAPAYSSTPIAVGSGFNKPSTVAVDAAGNVYVADAGNNAIKKVPAGGGASVTLGSGFSNPTGVAVDASGNVYVADFGNRVVKKIPVAGGTPVVIGSGFRYPYDVEVDATGNIYVGDNNNATPPVGSSANVYVKMIPANGDAVFNVSGGYLFIKQVAFDGAGNSYVVDANGSPYIEGSSNGLHNLLGHIYYGPNFSLKLTGLAMDATGNTYVADGSNNTVSEVPANNNNTKIPVGSVFGAVGGIKADGIGNVYVADANSTSIAEIKPIGGYYISPALPLGLKFDNATGIISGTPTVGSPATLYTITAYNSAGVSSSATVNIKVNITAPIITYNSPAIYATGSAITPLTPTSKNVDALDYKKTVIAGSGFANPFAVAVDSKGNIYVTDTGRGLVKKIPAGGGSLVTIGSGYISPQGIAVDATGNVYVTDPQVNKVYKIPVNGSPQVSIGTALNQPLSIAVDIAGNIYIGNSGNNTLIKIPADGSPQVNLRSGVNVMGSIAVDDNGNIYESDGTFDLIAKVPANGSAIVNFNGALSNTGITIDAAGNLYTVDHVGGTLQKIVEDGSSQNPGTILTLTGFNQPNGIAIDKSGNLYVADKGNNEIKKITPTGGYFLTPTLPAGLNFNNTTGVISGSPTVVSPTTNYTVTAYNSFGSSSTTFSFATAITPTITTGPVTGTITACLGDASANRSTQQFTISGNNLTDNITITAPANFEISTNATNNYNNTLVLSEVAGLVPSTVIYVRSSTTAPAGNISGNVVISSAGVTSQNIAVSGTINAPPVINGLPDMIVADGAQVVIPPFDVTGSTQITWSNGNTAIGLAASGTGNIPSFTATNTGNASIHSIITVTATSSSCAIVTKDFTITVAPAFSLPDNNFKLAVTSATCKGNNDGSINITSLLNNNYLATINGHGISASYQFTTSLNINNLSADTYHICITVQGYPEYLQCYDLVVSEPKDLSVYSVINSDNSLTLALSGGTQYNVQLNGQTYTTTESSITLPMAEGNNDITVTTDRLCQGSFKRLINISGRITPYPVPFQSTLSLNVGNTNVNNVNIEIHNASDGKLVYVKQYVNQSGVVQLDLTNLQGGVYALHLSMDNTEKIFKIIKK